MKKVFLGFGLVFLMVLVAVAITTAGSDDVKDGIPSNPYDRAEYGNITFEPPTVFLDALPVKSWVSGDTGVEFIAGHGAVLDASSFSCSGYSAPNAICYNSGATNADGSKPRLPAVLKFDPPVQYVRVYVASSSGAGSLAKIKAYRAYLSKVGEVSVSLTPAAKFMSITSGSADIEFLFISGPSVMIVDNLYFY